MLLTFLAQIGEGFLIKSIASFDDTLTRIPVISHETNTVNGRIAFSVGTLLALTVILFITIFFSSLLSQLPHSRLLVAGLILVLAVFIYFDIGFPHAKKLESKVIKLEVAYIKTIKIILIGFVVSFITLLDDAVILMPLFIGDQLNIFFAIIGIYLAAIVQILAVIFFGGRLEKFKYKKELASLSLLLLSILIFIGVL
jgi:hypothetical protein